MTEFTETLRHFCRNPRCRSKLLTPVSNPREAFCTKGCHSSFYRKRCLICEEPMERRNENQLICGKRRCRNALQARQSLGRYMAAPSGIHPLKNSIKPAIKTGLISDRPWHIVAAGEPISANAFHCATVAADEHQPKSKATQLVKQRPLESYHGGVPSDWRPCNPADPAPGDLSIPDFLRRDLPPLRLAA
jgi:hypothetical protein